MEVDKVDKVDGDENDEWVPWQGRLRQRLRFSTSAKAVFVHFSFLIISWTPFGLQGAVPCWTYTEVIFVHSSKECERFKTAPPLETVSRSQETSQRRSERRRSVVHFSNHVQSQWPGKNIWWLADVGSRSYRQKMDGFINTKDFVGPLLSHFWSIAATSTCWQSRKKNISRHGVLVARCDGMVQPRERRVLLDA